VESASREEEAPTACASTECIETDATVLAQNDEEEEKELEEDQAAEGDVTGKTASFAQQQARPPSPKISIVLEHDNEVVVEQFLPFAAKPAAKLSTAMTPKNATNGDVANAEDLFYSPLKLVSPKASAASSTTTSRPVRRSIIKRADRTRRSLSSSSLMGAKRRVSFDEATIIKHESDRKRKSTLETIRLAMPVILPYLIAILILVVSSLVPPAANPTTTLEQPAEASSATSATTPPTSKRKGFLGGVVKLATSSSELSELTEETATDDGVDCSTSTSTSTTTTTTLSRAFWTPHFMYEHVVTTRTITKIE
jgi:hypothetical protein